MNNKIARLLPALVVVALMLGGGAFMASNGDGGSGVFVASAQAQAAAAAAPVPAAGGGGGETQKGPPETLGDYWGMMGFTKWPLMASLIWVTSLVIELIIRGRVKSLCPPDAVAQISSTIAVSDYVKAWQYCVDNPSALTRTMAPVIEKIPKGAAECADAAMDYMNFQNNIFKVKCSYLNLNATVNTLLGLLGTISGMISAFNKMAYSGATGDPAKLAGSIGEALLCTWTGLGIAIASLYLFYVLTNRTKAAMTGMQNIVMRLIGEINFDAVTPDMEIVTAEMKSRAMSTKGGKGGGGAESAAPVQPVKAAAKAAPAAAAKAAEMIACPHCQHQIQVGTAKCPNCKTDLEWE